ncbi:hypothetical protein E4T42_02822 [Aureobasidium subglaciale]|nr:hypothetical protein E4T42_02822 [Aureobasidium subglaciale]
MNHSSSKRVRFVTDDDPAANHAPPRRMIRGYRDDDFDRYRREPLDYDEFEFRSPHIDRRQRYDSEDGYNLIVHGSDPNGRSKRKIDAPYTREELLEGLEALDRAHRDKELEIQRITQNRKRAADTHGSRQPSAKKPRISKGSRSDRLCLDCGNYHSTPCSIPRCSRCDTNHHRNVPCLEAMERLRDRIMRYAPPEYSHSSEPKFCKTISPSPVLHAHKKVHMPPSSLDIDNQKADHLQKSFSTLRTPTTLLICTPQSPQKRKSSPANRTCPLCRECGSFHRSPCKWLACEKCSFKHHPEVSCAMAEARLERRLEEEDAKQSQTTVDEEIKQREQRMIDINNQMASSTLPLRRSSAPSPGHESGPDTESKAIRLKKNTRFCRDCGRYLNKPCTWPTCRRCKRKHFNHISCSQARRELQSRLATFDRGYGVSLQKRAVSPQQAEHVIDNNRVHPFAHVNTKATPNFNFERNGTLSWPLESSNTSYYGPPPPDASAYPVTPSAQEQQDCQQYNIPARNSHQALSTYTINTAESGLQPSTKDALERGLPLPPGVHVASPSVAIPSLSIAQSVEALIAESAQAIHGGNANASEPDRDTLTPVDGAQSPPSYLEYLRRNGAE